MTREPGRDSRETRVSVNMADEATDELYKEVRALAPRWAGPPLRDSGPASLVRKPGAPSPSSTPVLVDRHWKHHGFSMKLRSAVRSQHGAACSGVAAPMSAIRCPVVGELLGQGPTGQVHPHPSHGRGIGARTPQRLDNDGWFMHGCHGNSKFFLLRRAWCSGFSDRHCPLGFGSFSPGPPPWPAQVRCR